MKRIIYLSLLLSLNFNTAFGQVFSNSTAQNIVGPAASATISIPVTALPSNVKLIQVNITFGDGSTQYNAEMNKFKFVLKDPSNNAVTLLSNNSFSDIATTSSNSNLTSFNIHFRDGSQYQTVKETIGSSGATYASGYPFYYGFYRSENNFSALNTGASVAGNWNLVITGTTGSATTSSKTRKFQKVELIFGTALPAAIDIKNGNQSCALRNCIQTGNTYLATNTSYVSQNNPSQNFDGCRWNADDNNKSWFYFVASGSTADISISGLSTIQQSVIVKSSNLNDCLNPFTSIPTGGCMGTMFGSSSTKQYYVGSYTAGNGTRWNHGYSLSGLTPGSMYIFVVEGSSNANSDFLIDITSGASGGCSPLPITLLSFNATPTQQGVSINWSTASERNNDYFTISRSSDLENWEEVGTVKGSGSINYKQDYNFTDIAPLGGVSYYRLKQTDFNGENESFDPVSVEINANRLENALVVYPNPTKAGFDVQVYAKSMNLATVSVHNVAGKSVINQTVQLEKGKNMVPMKNEKLEQGVYLVKIQFEDGTACLTKLVVD